VDAARQCNLSAATSFRSPLTQPFFFCLDRYKSALLMISDIQLVFKNCIEFNEQSSRAFADQARELEKIFARDLKKEGLSTFGDSNVTDAQKKDFSRMIYNITTVDLGQIVSVLDNRCPQCLTHNSNEVLS